jgi:probable HAF family extracellular repeat protein
MNARSKLLTVAVICFPTTLLATVNYTITDLGFASATGINNHGDVCGWTIGENGLQHALLYKSGSITYLGALPGGAYSEASAINNFGQVVGFSGTSPDPSTRNQDHAFLYSNGAMTDLGTLGGATSYASAINDGGQIVGRADIPGPNQFVMVHHAFIYSNGQMTDLGALGGTFSSALGINNLGDVVGSIDSSDPFIYTGGSIAYLQGVPPSGDRPIEADAINDSEEILGQTRYPDIDPFTGSDSFGHNAIFYNNGTVTQIDTFGGDSSFPGDINSNGDVVGSADVRSNLLTHAFYFSSGTMFDLNDLVDPSSGWILNRATGINDFGQIIGQGTNPSGQLDSFLLTPVPDPAALPLLLFPATLLLRRRTPFVRQV